LKAAQKRCWAPNPPTTKTAAEIKSGTQELVKWRAAAARLAADPQYASRKDGNEVMGSAALWGVADMAVSPGAHAPG